ncbi:MAG: hypothetical protein AB7P33_18535 [Dehalococcoidia bacterium]
MPFNPDRPLIRAAARAYWQRFIDEVEFDDPEQPRPRHGGHNWVRIVLPSPARWLGAYHYRDRVGVYLLGESDSPLFDFLDAEIDAIRHETGLDVRFDRDARRFGLSRVRADFGDDDAQLAWLCDVANRLVTALRPRLRAMNESVIE